MSQIVLRAEALCRRLCRKQSNGYILEQLKRLKDGRKIPAAEAGSTSNVLLPMYAHYAGYCAKGKEAVKRIYFRYTREWEFSIAQFTSVLKSRHKIYFLFIIQDLHFDT